ncbi:hypothetical protein [Polluticoccus soli]|uniref:hypothetical protein n=1 Tax=Polluticoccus soli TaxID=3034150 RepID=UPI0023E0CCE0|nr:hypothetical protein [Flavipsychrobacter sp. JY13-12]
MSQRSVLLDKLLRHNKGRSRLWLSLGALVAGTTLLLLAVMVWWNFTELLSGKHDNDSLGSTFLTVGKRVTNETMGKPNATIFTPAEIEAFKSAPQVQEVGALMSNRFPAYAVMNAAVGFSTEMFLEAVPERFMDKLPKDWHWQEGETEVPIIVSKEFLNLYNYGFALSQGLPQLSESSIQSISFQLKIGNSIQGETMNARVVGFSDRISSVLVPEDFLKYGNEKYAPGIAIGPSRLIVKAKDPSDPLFVSYLKNHDYTTNAEQLRWNKLRAIVDVVASATGLLAVLLMGIATMVFVLFIELTIAKAQASIKLLLEIGYSPEFLSSFLLQKFIPLVMAALMFAMLVALGIQYIAHNALREMQLHVASLPGWPVWAAFGISTVVLLLFVVTSIKRSISHT